MASSSATGSPTNASTENKNTGSNNSSANMMAATDSGLGGSMDQQDSPPPAPVQKSVHSQQSFETRSTGAQGSNRGHGNGPTRGGTREYCLRWNNHQPNLVTFFGNLLNKESFVDVTLVSSEGKKLQAHKLVLSACSPYFQHVFENNPCKHPIVILKDVHYADLRTIVSFIYNGEVNISQDRINTILSTASTLQIKGLAEVPADELKRVGGPGKSNSTESNDSRSRSHIPPLHSSWGSADGDEGVSHTEIPRKKLKKAGTNGDHVDGSFESGVGASMSRSMDDGNGPIDTLPVPRGPPPLTAGTQLSQHPKSRSLDTGMAMKREEGLHMDSELSSGGFSENQTYDDSSLGADRGYEVEEVADDGRREGASDDDIEYEEEPYDHDNDNSEFDQSFTTTPSSSLFYPDHRFTASVSGQGKGRHGRLLMRQPALRTNEGREPSDIAITGAGDSTGGGGIIKKADSKQVRSQSIEELESVNITGEKLQRQQSIVPVVMVSSSSPTPPSSPHLSHTESSNNILISDEPRKAATSTSNTSLLSIPGSGSSLDMVEVGGRSSSSGNSLVKQLSESQIPTMSSSSPVSVPHMRRQYSEGQAAQMSSIHAAKLLYPGIKPGDLFQIIPANEGENREGTYFLDSSNVLQIIPRSEGSSSTKRSSQPREFIKDMEIIRRDIKRDPDGGASFDSSASVDDSIEITSVDTPSTSSGVQRSGHCPTLRPGPALGCNYCWNSIDKCGRILRRKTKFRCIDCNINLCIVPCFQEYHEKADKKKVKRNILPKPSSM